MTQTPAHHVYSRSPMLQHVTHPLYPTPPPSCHVNVMYSWRPGRVETRRRSSGGVEAVIHSAACWTPRQTLTARTR